MMTSRGSRSQKPPAPSATAAPRPERERAAARGLHEAAAPPAEIRPSIRVAPSDQTTTLPPRPVAPSAAMSAPVAIVRRRRGAARRGRGGRRRGGPCRLALPRAEIPAPAAIVTLWPVTVTAPPLRGARGVEGARDPDLGAAAAEELDPSAAPGARAGADDAAGVDRGVEGPRGLAGGQEHPALGGVDAAGVGDAAGVAADGDAQHAVAAEVEGAAVPPASATVPRSATIAPAFSTSRPTSAARPASPMVIRPWLTTRAPACRRLAGEAAAALEAGGVRRLAGGDEAAGLDPAAAGEEDARLVLDDHGARRPDRARDHAGAPPCTRLSVAARRPGWSKTTSWPRSTSKLRQSITARREVWRTAVACAEETIRAAPRTTTPPSGPPATVGLCAEREQQNAEPNRGTRRPAPAVPAEKDRLEHVWDPGNSTCTCDYAVGAKNQP